MGSQSIGSIRESVPVLGLSMLIMVIFPGIFYLFLQGTSMELMPMTCSVLDAAMPMGLTAYALTQQYGLNVKLAGRLVLLSTFLSIFVLPAWIAFLTR
jgi:hypothetical protein